MNAVNMAILTALLVSTGISTAALFPLRRLPRSTNRRIVTHLLSLILVSNLLYLTLFPDMPWNYLFWAGILTHVFQMWGMAVLVRLAITLSRWSERADSIVPVALTYLPAVMLTVAVFFGAIVTPSAVTVEWSTGLTNIDYGYLGVLFLVTGAVYSGAAFLVTVTILLSKPAGILGELVLFLTILLVGLSSLALWGATTSPSSSAIFLLFDSSMGVLMAYTIMKRSPLIVPKTEEKPVSVPENFFPDVDTVPPLEAGATYLFTPGKRELARRMFDRVVLLEGKPGLWVTRKHPREIRRRYALINTPILWLTSAKTEDETCIDPREAGRLSSYLTSFIETAKDYIILIDGLEYIYATTGFQSTLRLVHFLNDRVMASGGVLAICIEPGAFATSEYSLLKSDVAQVFGEHTGGPYGKQVQTAL